MSDIAIVPGDNMSNYQLDFLMGDPLARFLVERQKWSPWKTAVLFTLFAWAISLIIAGATRTLFPNDRALALLEDYVYIITETVVIPVLWGYYVWICYAPNRVLTKLEATDVLIIKDENINRARHILENKMLLYTSVVLGILAGAIYFYNALYIGPPTWLNANPWLLAVRVLLVVIPGAIVTVSIAIRILTNARVFKKILSDVVLHPLHPDRAAGLRSLGQYALKTTYLIALLGGLAVLLEYDAFTNGQWQTAYFAHVSFIAYLLLAPFVFFMPLWSAHDAMLRAKEDMILEISRQFNHDISIAYSDLACNSESLKDNIEKVEQLQKLHELTESFPVWPFDLSTIRRFFLTMSSPALAIIIPLIIDYLSGLIFD